MVEEIKAKVGDPIIQGSRITGERNVTTHIAGSGIMIEWASGLLGSAGSTFAQRMPDAVGFGRLCDNADGQGARAITLQDGLLRLDQGPGGEAACHGGRARELDVRPRNLAEEIESLGRSDWRAARSQVQRVIEHLLKLEFSPAREPRSDWLDSIDQARDQLVDLLTPALRHEVEDDLVTAFDRARREAAKGLRRHGEHEAAKALPTVCSYSLDPIVSHDWFPENRHAIVDDLGDEA